MKKIVLTMIAAMMMGVTAMAQEANPAAPNNGERRQFDPKEMIKQRTDATVQRYGLNEEQAAKLLDLNTRFQGKLPMGGGMRGMRGQGGQGRGPQMGGGNRPQMAERPQRPQNDSVRGDRPQRPQGNFGANREEMQKNQEAYDAELKAIMTEEQYAAYKKDNENRRAQMRRGGDRPQRENNNN